MAEQPRGVRNYNPGNIEFGPFAQRHGAIRSDGRFAIFPDMTSGYAAQEALLNSYLQRGIATPQDIIGRWAPAGDGNNVSAYATRVAQSLGIRPDQPVTPDMIPRLAEAMAEVENGVSVPRASATANLATESGLPLPLPTPQPAPGLPPAAAPVRFPGSLAPPPSEQAPPMETQTAGGGIDDATLARLAEMVRQQQPQAQPADEGSGMAPLRVRGVGLDRLRSVLSNRGPLGTGART